MLFPIVFLMAISLHVKGDDGTSEVVGGGPAEEGFPYYGNLTDESSNEMDGPMCGAVLIDQEWALTAGHCIEFMDGEDFQIRFNWHVASKPEDAETAQVEEVVPHPEMDMGEHDISMIKLENPVPFEPAILPTEDDDHLYEPGNTVKGMGFGIYDPDDMESQPETLQVATFPIRSYCYEDDDEQTVDEENEFCAGSKEDTTGMAQRDSGSPLVVEENGQVYALGITSRGGGPYTTPEAPGIFINISSYHDWITEVMDQHSQNPTSSLSNENGKDHFKVGQKAGRLQFFRGDWTGAIEVQGLTILGQEVFSTRLKENQNQKTFHPEIPGQNEIIIIRARDEAGHEMSRKIGLAN